MLVEQRVYFGELLKILFAINKVPLFLVHSDSKDFKCPLCPKAYSSAIRLDQHKQSHTGELDCPFCEKTFKWKHSLVEHIRAHNGKMYFIDATVGRFDNNFWLKWTIATSFRVDGVAGVEQGWTRGGRPPP